MSFPSSVLTLKEKASNKPVRKKNNYLYSTKKLKFTIPLAPFKTARNSLIQNNFAINSKSSFLSALFTGGSYEVFFLHAIDNLSGGLGVGFFSPTYQ